VSVHADDEFSLRIALEGELDDVVPTDGLAGVVIARYRKTRRRRVAGAVGLVVVAAGIGVPLSMSGPGGKTAPHTPGGGPDRSAPRQHTGAIPLIGRYADHLAISTSSLSPAALVSLTSASSFAVAA
jgi:hypothetical protein